MPTESLTENQVIEYLIKHLKKNGYTIEKYATGTSQGHDIEGKTPKGHSFYIECKGSKSPRTNKDFSKNYKWRCACGAVFNQLRLRAEKPKAKIGIAFPDDEYYKETLMKSLREGDILKSLRIDLYWVSKSGYETNN